MSKSKYEFSKIIVKILKRCNVTSLTEAKSSGCQLFIVDDCIVGLIRSDFWEALKPFKDVFRSGGYNGEDAVYLSPDLKTCSERSDAVNRVLEKLREKSQIPCLQGWRHEKYKVAQRFTDETLLEIERAASGMFGFIQYGVHCNGYTRDAAGKADAIWVGRRSKTKQTFPDMLDNMCAGGFSVGMGVEECMRKECQEEASVPDKLLDGLKFAHTISYFYEDERGLFPECQFVYDLELPSDFVPVNSDGEMGSFQKCSIEELKDLLAEESFKPNCAMICVDFLIRHGFITPDNDASCAYYIEQLHNPLQVMYAGKL